MIIVYFFPRHSWCIISAACQNRKIQVKIFWWLRIKQRVPMGTCIHFYCLSVGEKFGIILIILDISESIQIFVPTLYVRMKRYVSTLFSKNFQNWLSYLRTYFCTHSHSIIQMSLNWMLNIIIIIMSLLIISWINNNNYSLVLVNYQYRGYEIYPGLVKSPKLYHFSWISCWSLTLCLDLRINT